MTPETLEQLILYRSWESYARKAGKAEVSLFLLLHHLLTSTNRFYSGGGRHG